MRQRFRLENVPLFMSRGWTQVREDGAAEEEEVADSWEDLDDDEAANEQSPDQRWWFRVLEFRCVRALDGLLPSA
eukprot:2655732-Rhodomonas_salina.1